MSIDVRDLLEDAAAQAPRGGWDLDEVVRRGRAARIRRRRRLAAGCAAAVAIVGASALVVPRQLTGGPTTPDPARQAIAAGQDSMTEAFTRAEIAVRAAGYDATPGPLSITADHATRTYVLAPLAVPGSRGSRVTVVVRTDGARQACPSCRFSEQLKQYDLQGRPYRQIVWTYEGPPGQLVLSRLYPGDSLVQVTAVADIPGGTVAGAPLDAEQAGRVADAVGDPRLQ